MRFLAALWDPEASAKTNIDRAGATLAWQQLGNPGDHARGVEASEDAMGDLSGTTVLITGAGRGLGRTMAAALAESGANVAIMERDAPEREDAVAVIGGGRATRAGSSALPATSPNPKMPLRLSRRWSGPLAGSTCWSNNAALGPQEHAPTNTRPRPPVWQVDIDLWLATLAVNASGPFIMTRAAIPAMLARGWGRIVTVTTSLDTMMAGGIGAYGPAKSCAEGFMSVLAHEVEGSGVTANVLIPGGRADTRMIPNDGRFADRNLLIRPEVMVAPIRWLASRDADGVNGRRFRAALFDPALPPEEAAEAAGAPVAWRDLGGQAIHF